MSARTPDSRGEIKTLQFHYVKSNSFRVIHVDGAIGGLTAHGFINAALYSERMAIPKVMEQDFTRDGPTGEERIVDRKDGLVREMDVALMMNRQAAEGLRDWLTRQIEEFDRVSALGGGKQDA